MGFGMNESSNFVYKPTFSNEPCQNAKVNFKFSTDIFVTKYVLDQFSIPYKEEDLSEWISVKEKLPPWIRNERDEFVIAYHTIYGVGVCWFWKYEEDTISELEEDFKDKYICSCHFIKSKLDENYSIDEDNDDLDVFENSPHFINLGTVTHWMPLPEPPKDGI